MRKIFNGLLQLHIVIMRILHLAHTHIERAAVEASKITRAKQQLFVLFCPCFMVHAFRVHTLLLDDILCASFGNL